VKHVQGHKVKHSNRNNSAADCSISLKLGKEIYQITRNTLQIFKVKGQGHGCKRSRSQNDVLCQY